MFGWGKKKPEEGAEKPPVEHDKAMILTPEQKKEMGLDFPDDEPRTVTPREAAEMHKSRVKEINEPGYEHDSKYDAMIGELTPEQRQKLFGDDKSE